MLKYILFVIQRTLISISMPEANLLSVDIVEPLSTQPHPMIQNIDTDDNFLLMTEKG